jgi:hypothetical protein
MVRNAGTFTGYVDGKIDLASTAYAGTNTFTDATLECWAGADKGDATAVLNGIINYIYLFPFAMTLADAIAIAAYPFDSIQKPNLGEHG